MEIPSYIQAQFRKPEEAPGVSTVLAPSQIDSDFGNLSDKYTPERKAGAVARLRNAAMVLPTGKKR